MNRNLFGYQQVNGSRTRMQLNLSWSWHSLVGTVATLVSFTMISSGNAHPGNATPTSAQSACANPANAIVAENCQAGNDGWQPTHHSEDVEIYAASDSVKTGDSLDFFVDTSLSAVNILIYRMGYYDGMGGRLIHTASDVTGIKQPDCARAEDTGLRTCSTWKSTYSLPIPDDWASGVYLAQINSPDGQQQNDTVFVVRQDERPSAMLYQMSTSTFQAYNNYGGKSTYSWNSGVCETVAEAPRAVKVSLNRPYSASFDDPNYFFRAEYPMLRWLEQQGYDVSYSTSMDTHRSGKPGAKNHLLDHKIFLSVGHDEYWSQEMRDAITAARDAGVHLGFFSSNTGYWRVRFEADPLTNEADSVMVTYKSTESGFPDPSGQPTGTWRDPNGANQPENALLGVMFRGDNADLHFPLRVDSLHGADPIYRHTGLQNLPPNSYVDVGEQIVGWEWDGVVGNGLTPASLQILAETPVYGLLLQDAGNFRNSNLGQAVAHTTRYTADSGAIVFASGTNQWSWGLGAHGAEAIEAVPIISQVTYNLLADMGVQPETPVSALIVDGSDRPAPLIPESRIKQAGDVVLPTISNLQITVDSESATVSWETDVETIAQLWYGDNSDHIIHTGGLDLTYATQHSRTVSDLAAQQTYYFQVAAVTRDWAVTLSDVNPVTTASSSFSRQISDFFNPLLQRGGCWVRGNTFGTIVMGGMGVLVLFLFAGRWWYVRRMRRQGAAV
jgi:hypothetical protein